MGLRVSIQIDIENYNSKMEVVSSEVQFLGYIYRDKAEIPFNDNVLITIRELLVMPNLKIPPFHHWKYFDMLVIKIHRLYTFIGLLITWPHGTFHSTFQYHKSSQYKKRCSSN